MQKNAIGIMLVVVCCACQNKETKARNSRFCECLAVSKQLNEEASKYERIALEQIADQDLFVLKKLIREKDSICEPYELLDAKELKEMRQKCGN